MRNLSLFLATASTAAALLATPALAEPTYPGISCVATTGGANASIRHDASLTSNDAASDISFVCPITKHKTQHPNAPFVTGIEARVVDRRTDELVRCVVQSRTATGAAFPFVSDNTTDAFADSAATLLEFDPVIAQLRSYLVLSCSVPGKSPDNERSGIVTYSVNESL